MGCFSKKRHNKLFHIKEGTIMGKYSSCEFIRDQLESARERAEGPEVEEINFLLRRIPECPGTLSESTKTA